MNAAKSMQMCMNMDVKRRHIHVYCMHGCGHTHAGIKDMEGICKDIDCIIKGKKVCTNNPVTY